MFKCLQMISITLVQNWCPDVGAWVYNTTHSSLKDWSSVGLVCSAVFLAVLVIWIEFWYGYIIVTQDAVKSAWILDSIIIVFAKSKCFFGTFCCKITYSVTCLDKSNQKRKFSLWVCLYSMRRNETMNFKHLHVASGRSSLCRGWAVAHFTCT